MVRVEGEVGQHVEGPGPDDGGDDDPHEHPGDPLPRDSRPGAADARCSGGRTRRSGPARSRRCAPRGTRRGTRRGWVSWSRGSHGRGVPDPRRNRHPSSMPQAPGRVAPGPAERAAITGSASGSTGERAHERATDGQGGHARRQHGGSSGQRQSTRDGGDHARPCRHCGRRHRGRIGDRSGQRRTPGRRRCLGGRGGPRRGDGGAHGCGHRWHRPAGRRGPVGRMARHRGGGHRPLRWHRPGPPQRRSDDRRGRPHRPLRRGLPPDHVGQRGRRGLRRPGPGPGPGRPGAAGPSWPPPRWPD